MKGESEACARCSGKAVKVSRVFDTRVWGDVFMPHVMGQLLSMSVVIGGWYTPYWLAFDQRVHRMVS